MLYKSILPNLISKRNSASSAFWQLVQIPLKWVFQSSIGGHSYAKIWTKDSGGLIWSRIFILHFRMSNKISIALVIIDILVTILHLFHDITLKWFLFNVILQILVLISHLIAMNWIKQGDMNARYLYPNASDFNVYGIIGWWWLVICGLIIRSWIFCFNMLQLQLL